MGKAEAEAMMPGESAHGAGAAAMPTAVAAPASLRVPYDVCVPLCGRACSFCPQGTGVARETDPSAYAHALIQEIAGADDLADFPPSLVVFTGADAGALGADRVAAVVGALERVVPLAGVPVRVDMNPESLNLALFAQVRRLQALLCFRIPTLDTKQLVELSCRSALGAWRVAQQLLHMGNCKRFGVQVAADLPGAGDAALARTVRELLEAKPAFVRFSTSHGLCRCDREASGLPAGAGERTVQLLEEGGYAPLPGRADVFAADQDVARWFPSEGGERMGLGAGACTNVRGLSFHTVADPASYVRAAGDAGLLYEGAAFDGRPQGE